MGNRATITSHPYRVSKLAVYVHWNGGRESIEAFCQVARDLGFSPISDSYGMARLVYAIGVFFGGELSLGVGTVKELRSAGDDNGTWVINDKWEVVQNFNCDGFERPLRPVEPEIAPNYAKMADRLKAQIAAAEQAGKDFGA